MRELKLTARSEGRNPRHARIGVFQNGGKAGVLTVEAEHEAAVLAAINSHEALLDVAKGHGCNFLALLQGVMDRGVLTEIERELVGSRAVLAEVTGAQATLFRPPGGNWDGAVSRAASRWGFTPVFWTCNLCDFYQNPRDRVVAGMMRQIEPGGIVLLHNGEDLTVEILLPLLEALRSEGYSMLSVSELLATRD